MTTVEIKRVNGECKACKAFHSYAVAPKADFVTSDGRTIACIVALTPNGPEYLGMDYAQAANGPRSVPGPCGKVAKVGAVQPKLGKAVHKCGASCRTAKSTECNCECGGAHHGANRT